MGMIRAIVDRQLIGLAVQGETTFGDTVGDTADRAAEIGMALQVRLKLVEPEDDISQLYFANFN